MSAEPGNQVHSSSGQFFADLTEILKSSLRQHILRMRQLNCTQVQFLAAADKTAYVQKPKSVCTQSQPELGLRSGFRKCGSHMLHSDSCSASGRRTKKLPSIQ